MKAQRGVTGWASLVFLLLILGAGVAAFRIGPVYINHWTVVGIFESLRDENPQNMTKPQIYDALIKRFSINMVDGVSLKDFEVKQDPDNGKWIVVGGYEVRVPYAFNVDLIVKFNDVRVELSP